MEPIATWSPETVRGYLRGLDPSLQVYPFQEWDMTGQDLLGLSPQRLDALGVRSIGHQEIILEAVEQLCSLHYELNSESLRSLTDKLYGVSQTLSSHILGLRKVSSYSPTSALSPTPKQLVCIIDIVTAARGLFSWLNRYLFTRLNDYSASRDIIALCVELAESLHKDWSSSHIEERIVLICQNICGICESILSCSPESLLNQKGTLESVQIHPEPPFYNLGIEIKSTSSGQHFICGMAAESPATQCGRILLGDEIIKVNDQVVVGWTRQNLVWKLREKSDCVTLILKKVSIPSSSSYPVTSDFQIQHSCVSAQNESISPTKSEVPISPTALWSPILKILRAPPTSLTAQGAQASQTKQTLPGEPVFNRYTQVIGVSFEKEVDSENDDDDMDFSFSYGDSYEGMVTKLSRRRVSCRDLGNPDCEGWLWKKKENVGFMSQRWKHCWCVLKGDRLYWYNAQQDEKALGLVNVSTYNLESSREPKKKYEFQLCHRTYKPFVFAADSLSDMSKWVTCLITALNKHKAPATASHTREEDCYSETEAEEQDEEQSRTSEMVKKQMVQPEAELPTQAEAGAAGGGQIPKDSNGQPEGDTLESLISCLKQGGVSLIGTKTVLTRDDYRKSFIRRNKNPEINQKAHTLRALQSTLKAKLLELEALNQILENPNLSSSMYRKWKSDHGQLYETLGRGFKARGSIAEPWGQPESKAQGIEPGEGARGRGGQ
ncbi:connector enhancer of kinase suppressor of ras 1 [Rhinophrynus dorsalis]